MPILRHGIAHYLPVEVSPENEDFKWITQSDFKFIIEKLLSKSNKQFLNKKANPSFFSFSKEYIALKEHATMFKRRQY